MFILILSIFLTETENKIIYKKVEFIINYYETSLKKSILI